MKFTKMQGLGNDYVYVNCFEEKIEDPSALAVRISDRHFGVGSDGLILINPSKWQIVRWKCTMRMVHAERCVEMEFAVLENICMIMG